MGNDDHRSQNHQPSACLLNFVAVIHHRMFNFDAFPFEKAAPSAMAPIADQIETFKKISLHNG